MATGPQDELDKTLVRQAIRALASKNVPAVRVLISRLDKIGIKLSTYHDPAINYHPPTLRERFSEIIGQAAFHWKSERAKPEALPDYIFKQLDGLIDRLETDFKRPAKSIDPWGDTSRLSSYSEEKKPTPRVYSVSSSRPKTPTQGVVPTKASARPASTSAKSHLVNQTPPVQPSFPKSPNKPLASDRLPKNTPNASTPSDDQRAGEQKVIQEPQSNPTTPPPPQVTNSPPAPPSSPPAPPPKPATWQENDPTGSWCPAEIAPHLDYLNGFEYCNHKTLRQTAFGGWHVLAATRRGKMHAHEGSFREDAFAVEIGDHFVIGCVSDGAGAYEYSRIGSETTCREVTRRLRLSLTEREADLASLDKEQLQQEVGIAITQAVHETCAFLHDLAGKAQCQPKDLRCTLLVSVLLQTPKARILLTSHVGDGFPAILNRQGQARRYGASDSGEFSGEVSCFIPDAEAPTKASKMHLIEPDETEAVIFCTDGIEDPFYPIEKKASQIFKQLYLGVDQKLNDFKHQIIHGPIVGRQDAAQLLGEWLAFEKQGENDDRTILILYREPVTVDCSQIGVPPPA